MSERGTEDSVDRAARTRVGWCLGIVALGNVPTAMDPSFLAGAIAGHWCKITGALGLRAFPALVAFFRE